MECKCNVECLNPNSVFNLDFSRSRYQGDVSVNVFAGENTYTRACLERNIAITILLLNIFVAFQHRYKRNRSSVSECGIYVDQFFCSSDIYDATG